jgi:hypothetical protein
MKDKTIYIIYNPIDLSLYEFDMGTPVAKGNVCQTRRPTERQCALLMRSQLEDVRLRTHGPVDEVQPAFSGINGRKILICHDGAIATMQKHLYASCRIANREQVGSSETRVEPFRPCYGIWQIHLLGADLNSVAG